MSDSQADQSAQRILALAEVSATCAGAFDAYEAAILGVLSALKNVPGVRESVAQELLRMEVFLLNANLNAARERQFDISSALVRATLAAGPLTEQTPHE